MLASIFHKLGTWFKKSSDTLTLQSNWRNLSRENNTSAKRQRNDLDLLGELKNTAWTCASINASLCASYPPRLYVITTPNQPAAKCLTKAIPAATEERLRSQPRLANMLAVADRVEVVLEHPLLGLLATVNPYHNAFDLWELTTLYQEIFGHAYWLLKRNVFQTPEEIWILPSQCVRAVKEQRSTNYVDYYEYKKDGQTIRYSPDEIICFRYPDPCDPYTSGLSPLRAAWDQVTLTSSYLQYKQSVWTNSAIPSAVVSPAEVIGEDEKDRMEEQFRQKYSRSGAGKLLFAESNMKVDLLSHSMGDLAALAEYGKTKEDVANAFGVPLSYLVSETNLANLQASRSQHLQLAIAPRNARRDEKLTEQLVPIFDPSGRLFLASDNPDTEDAGTIIQRQESDLRHGIRTINEIRADRGMPPVEWGHKPWLPLNLAPSDMIRRADYAPGQGRNRDPKESHK